MRIKAACHTFRTRSSNKARKKTLTRSERWLRPAEFVGLAPRGELKKLIPLSCKDAGRSLRLAERVAVPAGRGSSPLLPGGSDIMPAGTMTGVRGARCDWVRHWRHVRLVWCAYPRKPGPNCALGTMTPFGKSRGGTPEVVLPSPVRVGQRRSPQGRGGFGTASYGVPLPFSFLLRSPEGAKRNPGAALKLLYRPRISLRSIRATASGLDRDEAGHHHRL
jgi:hypothetical protein